MYTVIKEIVPDPWYNEENLESTNYSTEGHKPYDIVYVVKINPHPNYPTETCGGIYDTLEDAENSLKKNPYGGKIIQTLYGELFTTYF